MTSQDYKELFVKLHFETARLVGELQALLEQTGEEYDRLHDQEKDRLLEGCAYFERYPDAAEKLQALLSYVLETKDGEADEDQVDSADQ